MATKPDNSLQDGRFKWIKRLVTAPSLGWWLAGAGWLVVALLVIWGTRHIWGTRLVFLNSFVQPLLTVIAAILALVAVPVTKYLHERGLLGMRVPKAIVVITAVATLCGLALLVVRWIGPPPAPPPLACPSPRPNRQVPLSPGDRQLFHVDLASLSCKNSRVLEVRLAMETKVSWGKAKLRFVLIGTPQEWDTVYSDVSPGRNVHQVKLRVGGARSLIVDLKNSNIEKGVAFPPKPCTAVCR